MLIKQEFMANVPWCCMMEVGFVASGKALPGNTWMRLQLLSRMRIEGILVQSLGAVG